MCFAKSTPALGNAVTAAAHRRPCRALWRSRLLGPLITALPLSFPLQGLSAGAVDAIPAAINQVGLELYRAQAANHGGENLLLSPYSIQVALAMAYAGADGATREEMQRVLHLPADEAAVFGGFATLGRDLIKLQADSKLRTTRTPEGAGRRDPLVLHFANRLFSQSGFALRPAFTRLLNDQFEAPLNELDFKDDPEAARDTINRWVELQTRERIRDLVPQGTIRPETRTVLVNAIYLNAPWDTPFETRATTNQPFSVNGQTSAMASTMRRRGSFRYEKRDGFALIALPYEGRDLQFLILLPDQPDGLPAAEQTATPALLAEGAQLPHRDVVLHLPKFKLEPSSMLLGGLLRGLGMTTAFDRPRGSANFDRMAPRKPDEYLYISEVIHRAWLSLDEQGTEAAAATAVIMAVATSAGPPPLPPIEVRVDRPFLFAIQHVPSGACLFLGRVTDPR
jgi:serpin B